MIKFDNRTTAEVEATRSDKNMKPYRTKAQKVEARKTAVKTKDGTWRSTARVSYHKNKPG